MPELHSAETGAVQAALQRCVVLGIGNSLMGDDGVGIHVIRNLRDKLALPTSARLEVEYLDGGTLGYLLIDKISGADALIVVDAANLGADAGAVRVFAGDEMHYFLNASRSASVHEVSLIDLLQMMILTGQMPDRCALVGVQPENIDWNTEVSAEVRQSIPVACMAISTLIENWYGAY